MKKLVLVLLLAACAASPLLFATPAQAQWVKDGLPTYDPNADQTATTGVGVNTMQASVMAVKSTASVNDPNGTPVMANANCKRTYTQNFKWNGQGTSTWVTWRSALTGGADGNFTAQGSFTGMANSSTGAGFYGQGSGSCNGPTGSYNNPISTPTSPTYAIFSNQSGHTTASRSYTLSASISGQNGSGGGGQFTTTAHASLAMGDPQQ